MRNAFQSFISYLLCDWVASLGAIVVTTSAVIFLTFAFQSFSNPYYGLIVFLVFPAFFVLGLVMIPVGVWRCSRRRGGIRNIPRTEITGPRVIQFFGLIAFLTIVNVAIISAATYRGGQYMDSNEFCGTVCHTVMTPQYTAYQNSPHSRVHCVNCHVGPGAEWFVHYKLSGVRQVLAVTFDSYPRPIPPGIRSLRPSQDTCEQCHWPGRPQADRVKVIRRYEEDEKNTEKVTVLLMRTGTRIHKTHVGRAIEYVTTDAAHQDIPWVSVDGIVYKSGAYSKNKRHRTGVGCRAPVTMPGSRRLGCGRI